MGARRTYSRENTAKPAKLSTHTLRSEEGERFLLDLITQSTIAGNSGQIETSEWNVNERPQKN